MDVLVELDKRLVEKRLKKYRREAFQATLSFWNDNNKEQIVLEEAVERGIKTAELIKELNSG